MKDAECQMLKEIRKERKLAVTLPDTSGTTYILKRYSTLSPSERVEQDECRLLGCYACGSSKNRRFVGM
jgi:hypothetical protein